MSTRLAFVFPGQGSQSVGMLGDHLLRFPVVTSTLEEGSDALGYDLARLISEGPADRLDRTEYTQPALLAASICIWRVWLAEHGAMPVLLAGHSLGEYSALVAADSLDFAAALRLVQERGRYMQTAVAAGAGAMAAVLGLPDADVDAICTLHSRPEAVVEPANYNAPGQVVIAGHGEAVTGIATALRQAGAKRVLPLNVSAPSHCSLMRPAAEQLAQRLAEVTISPPRIPVLQNLDGKARSEAAAIREALVAQLYSPVRWTETIARMTTGYNVGRVLECGPGRVLGGLVGRIAPELQVGALATPVQLLEACNATCDNPA
jgi:[acyl-carrier-protein] S-malonyltransferase